MRGTVNSIFLGLAASTVVFFLAAGASAVVPMTADPRDFHSILGLFQTLLACLTHSVVFVYFLGTGRAVKEVIEKQNLDVAALAVTRRLKARAFPFAFSSALLAVAVAILGGAASRASGFVPWHAGLAIGSLAFNLLSFVREYGAIRDNQKLLSQVYDTLRGHQ